MPQFYQPDPDSLAARLSPMRPILAENNVPGPVIEFTGWNPDRADFANPGEPDVLNVIPVKDGYGPFKGFSALGSDPLGAAARGAAITTDTDGAVIIHAGDATKLYSVANDGTTTDISKSGGYSTAVDENWEWTFDGENFIATNYFDNVQSFDANSGTLYADHFTSTLKPKARHLDFVRNQLVLGNTNDTGDGAKPSRVWWSSITDTADMDPDADTLCDFEDVKNAGWNQKIVGGTEFGLAFFESAIERMTFVGGDDIFQFDRVDRKRGTLIPNSVIAHGRTVFFISPEGFMKTEGTGNSVNLGYGKIDKEFFNEFDITYKSNMSSSIDPENKLVLWGFASGSATGGVPDVIYVYSWAENQFARVEVDHELLLRSVTQGLTLDQLDTINTSLDALPFGLDSRAWTGGVFKLAGFNASHNYGTFDGNNLAATLITKETMHNPGHFSRCSGMVPIIDGGTAITGEIGYRSRIQDSVVFDTLDTLNADGIIPANNSARYQRGRIIVPAGSIWTHAQGVEFLSSREGIY